LREIDDNFFTDEYGFSSLAETLGVDVHLENVFFSEYMGFK
jgi:hypothetical protein